MGDKRGDDAHGRANRGGGALWVKHVTVNIYKFHHLKSSGASRAGARTRVVATGAIIDGYQTRAGRTGFDDDG